MVVKHLFKRIKSVMSHQIVYFIANLLWDWFSIILQIYQVKKIKARILDVCVIVQGLLSGSTSIASMKDLQTYGRSGWTVDVLITMAFTNCLKNIADLRQIIKNIAFNCNSNFSLKYVKSSFLIGIRIRSPIIPQNVLKVYREAKRASYFVYNFCSVCSVESRELIAGELKRLCEYSEKK
jgi:hypothetical protein